jgi:hypothetical protein
MWRRKIQVDTKDCAAFVKTVKFAPFQNPRVGSGIAKSIDERTTIFFKRVNPVRKDGTLTPPSIRS